jgi:hypothetical protein
VEKNSEKIKRSCASSRCVGALAGGYSMARIKRLQSFTAATGAAAIVHVDAILGRGNFAQMKNIAGQFVVSEVVLA